MSVQQLGRRAFLRVTGVSAAATFAAACAPQLGEVQTTPAGGATAAGGKAPWEHE